jgi:spermidine synthase
VRVLHSKGCDPRFTLVENDKVVLEWALECLDEKKNPGIEPVCIDAQLFMLRNTAKYDLIFIDVFTGRIVPTFVTTPLFLEQCRNSLNAGGRIVLNYIINDDDQWKAVSDTFSTVFPRHHMLSLHINRILITE